MRAVRHDPMSSQEVLSPEALGSADRRRIGELWLTRCKNELSTSTLFRELYPALGEFAVPGVVLELGARAEAEERRHAELCFEMARRYLGDVELPTVAPVGLPRFRGCDARTRALLAIVQHCCYSETIATAYLGECRQRARVVDARRVLQQILSDEVSHSRLGWALVAQLGNEDLATLGRACPALTRSAMSWIEGLDPYEGVPEGHGFLAATALRDVFFSACEDLVLPGLAYHGVDVAGARRLLSGVRLATG
jgi:hypothetical protein